jgi:hypothetical protein
MSNNLTINTTIENNELSGSLLKRKDFLGVGIE